MNDVRSTATDLQGELKAMKDMKFDSPEAKAQYAQQILIKPQYADLRTLYIAYNLDTILGEKSAIDSIRQAFLQSGETELVTPTKYSLIPRYDILNQKVMNYPFATVEPNAGVFQGTPLENIFPTTRFGSQTIATAVAPQLTNDQRDQIAQALKNYRYGNQQLYNKVQLPQTLMDELTSLSPAEEENVEGITQPQTSSSTAAPTIIQTQTGINGPLSYSIQPQYLRLLPSDISTRVFDTAKPNLYGDIDITSGLKPTINPNINIGTTIVGEGAPGDELFFGTRKMYREFLPGQSVLESTSIPITATSNKPVDINQVLANLPQTPNEASLMESYAPSSAYYQNVVSPTTSLLSSPLARILSSPSSISTPSFVSSISPSISPSISSSSSIDSSSASGRTWMSGFFISGFFKMLSIPFISSPLQQSCQAGPFSIATRRSALTCRRHR